MRIFLIFFIVALLALGGFVAMSFTGGSAGSSARSGGQSSGGNGSSPGWLSFSSEPSGTSVRSASAVIGDLIEVVKAPGVVEPLTKVDISAEVSARILQLPFREGNEVHKGDVILVLDGRDLQAALDSSKARRDGERHRLESERSRLAGLSSTIEFAQKQLERQQELFSTGDVPRKSLDDAMERVQDLQANINSAQHAISVIESSLAASEADILRAEEGLSRTVIHAPMDGVVTKLNAEVGELVVVGTMNNPGTIIMTVADLTRMVMKANIAESDIAKIAPGQQATIRINAYGKDVFSGEVHKVALQRTTATAAEAGHFTAEVSIDLNGRRLLSGLAANVDVQIKTHHGVIVPSQAIGERIIEKLPATIAENPLVDRSRRSTTVVFRIVDGKAICTPVKAGSSDDTRTVVMEGLQESEQVVTGPYKILATIEHDAPVKIENTGEVSPAKPAPQAGARP